VQALSAYQPLRDAQHNRPERPAADPADPADAAAACCVSSTPTHLQRA
jgi:hypothetical protein